MVFIAVPGVSRLLGVINDLQFVTPRCVCLSNVSQPYIQHKYPEQGLGSYFITSETVSVLYCIMVEN